MILNEPSPNKSISQPNLGRLETLEVLDRGHLRVLKGLEKPGAAVSFLTDLIQTFMREVPLAAESLLNELERESLSSSKYAAHQLKGIAGNLGALRLAALAEGIEIEIEEGRLPDAALIKPVLDRFREEAVGLLIRDWKA